MRLENITFSITDGARTRHILKDVSLEVQPGELVAVMGPREQLRDIGASPSVLRRYCLAQALIIAVPAILLGVAVTMVGLR